MLLEAAQYNRSLAASQRQSEKNIKLIEDEEYLNQIK